MPPSGRIDPFAGFNFLVEIDGVTTAGFTSVSGLTSEVDVVSFREGASSECGSCPASGSTRGWS
jgi:phage tail-like protein